MTLSTKYFVDAGSTSPETRFTAIKRKPRMSTPRRGFISAQTSGRFFQAFLRFLSLSVDAALALASVVIIWGASPIAVGCGGRFYNYIVSGRAENCFVIPSEGPLPHRAALAR